MLTSEKLTLLKKAFPDVADDDLLGLAEMARLETYPPDTVLTREGEPGDRFYLISDGEIEVTKRFSETEERVMRTAETGDYFGEMALLDDEPRTANIRTLRETSVLELDRPTFQEALRLNPNLTLTLVRTIIKRMRANDTRAIAELREQKEELAVAYGELSRQEQQRDVFLNTLAHELRTPLTTTSGYIDLLKAGVLEGASLETAVEKIDGSFKRVISLINDLLFIQEMETLDFGFVETDVLDILEAVYEGLAAKAQAAGVEVQLRTLTPVPLIKADHAGLTRTFRHLLDNAIKFSPEGGDVQVNVGVKRNRLEINFIDHGVGIEENFMPRLFKRFERMETVRGYLFDGAGLGLPIVKHIVERHGGTIDVQSTPGQGSTFTVRLPLEREQAGAEA